MALLNIGLLLFIGIGVWWLTGVDKTAGGESKRGRYLTRALRCLVVVFLSAAFLGPLENNMQYGGVPIMIIAPMGIALALRSSLSEVFTHGFLGMIDPALHDYREFDPKKARRYQDAIAHLIHNGQREQAIKLCEELKLSGEVDRATIDNTLEFLGVAQSSSRARPLHEAARLRADGKFTDAESLLKSLLVKNPADDGAALMLMRLYAQDLRQAKQAEAVLRALEKQPHVPASHVEFARRSIQEWSNPEPASSAAATVAQPASVDELLAQGSFGTAVELLEAQLKTQPDDFQLQVKLAEVYALHCKNLQRAEKIIGQLERAAQADPQQIALARAKLQSWRDQAWRTA